MYDQVRNYFGLKRMPFVKTIAAKELFKTNALTKVASRLKMAIEGEDFALISGSAGSGKSSAVRYFISLIDPAKYPVIYITAENYKIQDIAKLILHGLNAEVPYNGFAALRKVKLIIKKLSSESNIKPILIIDEAHELPVRTLSSVKNLVNFEMDSESRLTCVFIGQIQLLNKINMAELSSLKRRIRIRYKFDNLSLDETNRFIEHQLNIVGATKAIFTEDAKAEIFRVSNGMVCNINNICFDLLIQAVEDSKEIIEPSLLASILTPE